MATKNDREMTPENPENEVLDAALSYLTKNTYRPLASSPLTREQALVRISTDGLYVVRMLTSKELRPSNYRKQWLVTIGHRRVLVGCHAYDRVLFDNLVIVDPR